jgi:hypothetical protein
MIKSLRKRHRQVWVVWAILLPAGIIFAWLVIPDQLPVKLLQQQTAPLLPSVVSQKDMEDYTITLRSDIQNNKWQLQWRNKKVLTVPSAVIYYAATGERPVTSNELIGRIEARGEYVFPLRSTVKENAHPEFILYDFIHEKVIEKIIL